MVNWWWLIVAFCGGSLTVMVIWAVWLLNSRGMWD